MPFSGPGDPSLPSNVIDLSVEKRRQWVGAWNGRFAQCQEDGDADCESSAFAVANSAIKGTYDGPKKRRRKKKEDAMGDDQRPALDDGEKFMEVYDVFDRQISQEEAAYLPAGGLDGSPCAVCRWFIPPDNCVVVANWPEAISSIGTSNRFEARPVPEVDAVPVMIVDGDAALSDKARPVPTTPSPIVPGGPRGSLLKVPTQIIETVAEFARGLVKRDDGAKAIGSDDGIHLYRMKDDSLRWFVWASNKFQDKEGEIFEERAHKEFVGWLDDGGKYPEAWVWHTPGTRWGVADWADYADGFLMYSGTVDPGMEDVAIQIANTKGLGVSHGFKYLYSDEENGIIGWYRDYEISTLPIERAANLWTGIEVLLEGGKAMGFTAARREHLVEFFGEAKVKEFETNTNGVKTIVEGLGLAWKEGPEFGDEDDKGMAKADGKPDSKDGDPTDPQTVVNNNTVDVEAMAAAAVKAVGESEAFKDIGTKIGIVNNRLTQLEADMTVVKASDDEKVAGKFAPKATPVNGHRASGDDDNVSDDGDGKDEARDDKRGPIATEFADSFFGNPEQAKV